MKQIARSIIDTIKDVYINESDVCMYDLLATTAIQDVEGAKELTFEEVMEIYAILMNWSDNDEFYRINVEDNFKHDIVGGEHTPLREEETKEVQAKIEVTSYREQTIVKHSESQYEYFLFNEDGDVDGYSAPSLEKCKERIDRFIEEHNGYYNSDGELVVC